MNFDDDSKAGLYLDLLIKEIVKGSRRKLLTGELKDEFASYIKAVVSEDVPTILKLISKTSFYAGAFVVIRQYIAAREELLEEGIDARMDDVQEEIAAFFKDIRSNLHDVMGSDALEAIPDEAFGKMQ